MQCPQCQQPIHDKEAVFCSHCGARLHHASTSNRYEESSPLNTNFCAYCGAPANYIEIQAFWKAAHHLDTREKFHQNRWEKLGLAEHDWVEISGGEFLMGSPSSEAGRFEHEIQHPVSVKRLFMLRTPVTFAMYDHYCDELKLTKPSDEGWGRDDRPVINITYWEAVEYCVWLRQQTGWPVRLPTEAEWEYACRAGTKTPFSTGETITPDQANFDGHCTYQGSPKGHRLGRTSPVYQFPPNPWGLYDLHGNVWEWCASVYDPNYTGKEQQDACHLRENLNERVVRGGSWYNVPGSLRSASRNKMGPNYHYLRIGFRIVYDAR